MNDQTGIDWVFMTFLPAAIIVGYWPPIPIPMSSFIQT
jgi:hypothetical protein